MFTLLCCIFFKYDKCQIHNPFSVVHSIIKLQRNVKHSYINTGIAFTSLMRRSLIENCREKKQDHSFCQKQNGNSKKFGGNTENTGKFDLFPAVLKLTQTSIWQC